MENLYRLSEALTICESVVEVERVCVEFCDISGFEYFVFWVCGAASIRSPQVSTMSNYPKMWREKYFGDNLQKFDPVVRYCFEKTTPVTWNKLIGMDAYCDAAGLEIMKEARNNGLVDGLSVPLKASTGETAIFSMTTKNADKVEVRLLKILPLAQYFGHILLETYLRICLTGVQTEKLTPREKESLLWACEGKTAWEISQIMNVSERTAIFHLGRVTKKLGASNRQHAVAKALMNGLVKPSPF